MESLNHYPNWLKTITNEIDKFLIDRKYIIFFMQMYMQWIKDDGSPSSYQTLIITRLSCFEKLSLSQFQLYIEAQTTTQCFVCRNFQKDILIWSAKGKNRVFCILHMLRIHTSVRTWHKKNVFDIHLFFLIHLIYVYRVLILQRVNCDLNNIEWILIRTNTTLEFKMMMQERLTEYFLISCNKRPIFWMNYIYVKDVFW